MLNVELAYVPFYSSWLKRIEAQFTALRYFALEAEGYTATRHQREVGAGYFDDVGSVISGGKASTLALKGSTEEDQF